MADLNIKAGDTVRAFDFDNRMTQGDDACYVEGLVLGILNPGEKCPTNGGAFHDCPRYIIKTVKRVWGGVVKTDVPTRFYPPVNGTVKTFGGVCNGVVKVNVP